VWGIIFINLMRTNGKRHFLRSYQGGEPYQSEEEARAEAQRLQALVSASQSRTKVCAYKLKEQ